MSKQLPMFVFCTLFSGWAFITCLNDILTNILKNLFQLTQFEAQFVPCAFFIAYFIGSIIIILLPMFKINTFIKLGLKKTVIFGIIISAIGCLIFIPAAQYKNYSIFLVALFTIGFGFTFLQISVNPMVLSCGDPKTAASRLNIAGGFNSLATSLSPIIGAFILYNLLHVNKNPERLGHPYTLLALILLALAYMVHKLLPAVQTCDVVDADYSKLYALNHSNLLFGAIALFFYVGAEVSIGSNLIAYLKSKESLGSSDHIATILLTFYWGGAMVGRFLGGIALNKYHYTKKIFLMLASGLLLTLLIITLTGYHETSLVYYIGFLVLAGVLLIYSKGDSRKSLVLFALINIINIAIVISIHGIIPTWTLLSIGIFNSIMWPNIFDLSLNGLGRYKEQGSSILIATILGGALIPILQGKLADIVDIATSFIVPGIGYIYIICYGIFYSTKRYNLIKTNKT